MGREGLKACYVYGDSDRFYQTVILTTVIHYIRWFPSKAEAHLFCCITFPMHAPVWGRNFKSCYEFRDISWCPTDVGLYPLHPLLIVYGAKQTVSCLLVGPPMPDMSKGRCHTNRANLAHDIGGYAESW